MKSTNNVAHTWELSIDNKSFKVVQANSSEEGIEKITRAIAVYEISNNKKVEHVDIKYICGTTGKITISKYGRDTDFKEKEG